MNMLIVTGEAIMSLANAAQSLQEASSTNLVVVLAGLLGYGQFDFLNSV